MSCNISWTVADGPGTAKKLQYLRETDGMERVPHRQHGDLYELSTDTCGLSEDECQFMMMADDFVYLRQDEMYPVLEYGMFNWTDSWLLVGTSFLSPHSAGTPFELTVVCLSCSRPAAAF